MTKTQLEISKEVIELTKNLPQPITVDSLITLRDHIYNKVSILPYNEATKEQEKQIRWKRNSTQILQDAYVYDGKFCTDIVVVFLAACNALNLETRFVKLKRDTSVHSVAEVKLDDGWHIFDVLIKGTQPIKGEISLEKPHKNWQLWKKGRDAWDLDLTDFESLKKIAL